YHGALSGAAGVVRGPGHPLLSHIFALGDALRAKSRSAREYLGRDTAPDCAHAGHPGLCYARSRGHRGQATELVAELTKGVACSGFAVDSASSSAAVAIGRSFPTVAPGGGKNRHIPGGRIYSGRREPVGVRATPVHSGVRAILHVSRRGQRGTG